MRRALYVTLFSVLSLALSGCGGSGSFATEQLLILDGGGTSFRFVPTNTYDTSAASVTITGLQASESFESVDYRPSTGVLFGMTNQYRLYSINTTSGAATLVGGPYALTGVVSDMDFNPVADRIRVMTNTGKNIRLNPANGTIAGTDTDLAFAAGDPNFGASLHLAGAAYSNNVSTATTTTLYAIDAINDVVGTVGGPGGTPSPNAGGYNTIALTTPPLAGSIGMDISGATGVGYVIAGVSGFIYTIDLSNGNMTSRAAINAQDITVVP